MRRSLASLRPSESLLDAGVPPRISMPSRRNFTYRPNISAGEKAVPEKRPTQSHAALAHEQKSMRFDGVPLPPNQSQLSPAALQLERDIERGHVDPVEHLRNQLKQGVLDFELVRVCLNTYRSLRLIDRTRTERIELIKTDQIGALILNWLWKDETRWARVLEQDMRFFEDLCYFLAAERKHKYILEVLKLKNPSDTLRPAWRGILLRALVRGLLANVVNRSADEALDVFLQLAAERKQFTAHQRFNDGNGFRGLSLAPASFELASHLITGTYPATTPSKFRRYMKFYRGYVRRTDEYYKQWTLACLAVSIPDAPDPDPAMAILRESFDGPTPTAAASGIVSGSDANRARFYLCCTRLEHLLSQQDRREESQWVTSLKYRMFSDREARQIFKHVGMDVSFPGSKIRKTHVASRVTPFTSWTHDREKASRVHRPASDPR